mmetsp:Transcript_56557/g.106088  ORF Transcript_56557/g.106088 Transcript_56557/m.106088 type:complete len:247 (-) Transcript_56557:62-802(-)
MQDDFDAGCLLSLGVLVRLAVAALNYEIYCMLDGSPSDAPSITELSDYATGSWGPWRYALALLSVTFSDACCYLVLSHAATRLRQGPGPSLLQALILCSCVLDIVQLLTAEFRLHWVPIQLAGVTMCLTLLYVLVALWQRGGQPQRLQTTCWTFLGMCTDLLLVAALHNQWIGRHTLTSVTWTSLEYFGIVLYTAVMVQLGGLLPPAMVKMGWPPRIVPRDRVSSESLLPQQMPRKSKPVTRAGSA